MDTTVTQYKKELLKEIKGLPSDKVKEVLNFICFIKAKEVIDPAQAYFWTKKWQKMEKGADRDRKRGNVIGNGTVKKSIRSSPALLSL
ncbi:MAG: hypothetical protein A2W77_06525 [Nitrospinae bacterium RIFCSPLOWO2_12_39_16]|nr:MAG: hypothetical protein A2Z59_09155 [Nitrospinae bacterium RIFCSPLOWO2_02_39_17]OGW12496.1 MAG: hypothetical protein A2W77_06525 [Nitrospinae bacterium RIFCSPLOWO2_12_39_16]